MSEFNELLGKIQKARKDREAGQKVLFRSKEQLKRLLREKEQTIRYVDEESKTYQDLLEKEKGFKKVIAENETRLAKGLETERGLIEHFKPLTDPRLQLKEFSDDYPILLFPVRLETRFKRTKQASGGIQHQLWVRIFPDTCSIDTFDDTLSESELKKAQNYWIDRWKAGTAGSEDLKSYVRDKEKGAWRELMGIFNAGRAHWILANYLPVNADDIPVRNGETEIILVIPVEELPDEATRDALRVYWSSIFLANGNAEQVNTAFAALADSLGISEENASQLIKTYKPQNIETELDTAAPPPDVQVSFLQFPESEEVETKLAAWSHAARVKTLPERFVLLGYQKGNPKPVVEELGEYIADPLIVGPDPGMDINQVLKAAYGDVFETLTEDEKAEKYIEYLSQRSETKWLFDFDEAIKIGMGFKVNISKAIHDQGFERLFVLGVKLSADQEEGQSLLEELIKNHHFGDSGFSILPQGTPTNNTEESRSGYSESEDADQAYERYHSDTPPDDPSDETEKLDGRWLAELLGIGIEDSTLNLSAGYYQKDQREARAMNTALWNATIGYFMESMLTPVFSEWQRNMTRWFLIQHVSGRGRIPAIRIGNQPYGILPVTTFSSLEWLSQDETLFSREHRIYLPALNQIYRVLKKIKEDWDSFLYKVAHVGKQGNEDGHTILLQALGLHANSVEFDQRYAESFQHQYNWLKALGISDELFAELLESHYKNLGMDLLKDLGYNHDTETDPKIPILEKYFFTKENDVNKHLIDDQELSEVNKIRAYSESGFNYIEWLIENAKNNHQNIREQKDFIDDKAPYALLFDMLRHALNLEFGNTGLKLYRNAEILDEAQVTAARVDADFIGIKEKPTQLESKWDLIYRKDNRIAGDGKLVVDHISHLIKTQVINSHTQHLHEIMAALELLKETPTARLERVFVEHLDCCTYRLDAWLLGFVNLQLRAMRFGGPSNTENPKKGIYFGAYGWLENLKPENKTFEPVRLSEEMREVFDPEGDKEIKKDKTNAGYVHAPSINHGMTAAVLRNAYISNASKENAEPYKVNLSSERVRLALSMIEGIQQGQSLEALLGYQLERGLHDRTNLELDIYIYELRKVFPLVSNKMILTQIKSGKIPATTEEAEQFQDEEEAFKEDRAVTKIEARNVVNGLSLLNHIKETGKDTYPFGFPIGEGPDKLKSADSNQRDAINKEVKRLMNIRDAVADLAMAESVHQVVQGNYDRATGALDAYSKGAYPQLPDVIQSPGSGISLTHRFGIHLPSGILPNAGDTPRSKAEPAVNKWLEEIFPDDLSKIACLVEYQRPDYDESGPNPVVQKTVSMANLGLKPIDLLYMLNVESEKSLTALDDLILKFVHAADNPRPDVTMQIKYTHFFDPGENTMTFFEMASLILSLRSLVVSSRPLLPTDMALQNEAKKEQNSASSIDRSRITGAKQKLSDIVDDLQTDVVNILTLSIDDEDFEVTLGNQGAIMDAIDTVVSHFIDHMHQLSLYGIPQSGFGFVYDRKSAIYSAVYQKIVEIRSRWQEKKDKCEDLIDNQFPAAVSDEEKIRILNEAERAISTQLTINFASIPALQTIVNGKKSNFDTKFDDIQTLLAGNFLNLKDLVDEVDILKTGWGDFDLQEIDIDKEVRQILAFAEDLYSQAKKLSDNLDEKMNSVQSLLDDESASANPEEKIKFLTEAAKIIFGEEFKIIPEFTLSEEQGSELQKSLDDQNQLLDYQKNTKSNDFPMDDWLYGVARVREKMAAWENLVMLAEGIKDRSPLDLTPLQLPYVEDDHWLGLEYPEGIEIPSDKLLYTAYLPGFNPGQPQCGLLVDEWTEVIPAKKETTGMTFHYDRPNSEPPQTMLLATPSAFRGEWNWSELVKTLDETLDLAKFRAIEPDHVDASRYARFLPATVAAAATSPVSMILNYLLASAQTYTYSEDDNA
jgi:hypothetical protein